MKAVLQGIFDRGNIQLERVHFRALTNIDLRFFAIVDSQYQQTPGSIVPASTIEAGNKNCHWFTAYQVKAGENVVLYTRGGKNVTEARPDGAMFHFFFRGVNQPLYGLPNRCAVLFELNDWATTAFLG
jgi:hypothetical protein